MRSVNNFFATILFATIIAACDETPSPADRQAVIEGYISNDGYPTVYFTSSVTPDDGGSISDAVINWGKVTIDDGEREVVLTGRVDDTGLPPYRYYTLNMVGESGRTYRIKADFKDLHAVSEVRMPFPTPIDGLTFEETSVDTLRAVTLHFTSPEDTPAYYYISMRKQEKESRFSPCVMGSICADIPGAHYSIPVLKPRIKIDGEKYVSSVAVGEKWEVSLNRVEKEVYEFWKAYDNMILFSNSPFISSSQSLPTNIVGGLGIWSPQGVSTLRFEVE